MCGSLNILWHCLSFGLESKLTFSSPVATAEFGIFNKTEIDVFLELSCSFDDPADVGNLISGRSTAGIKIARRNINNLKYADDTTLMAEAKN